MAGDRRSMNRPLGKPERRPRQGIVDQTAGLQAASPPPASLPIISFSASRFRSLSLQPNQAANGLSWVGKLI
ncbi:hypothetical protein TIFTF001_020921 [Ficus carica]|uniref:Uncharacterized protein n=1 Tax=Ficus carica TaxID=3494 RepID=A0AA88AEQ8_FICCA|nr:hypothetical protein TIFTF001_020921 [Ficus carica]